MPRRKKKLTYEEMLRERDRARAEREAIERELAEAGVQIEPDKPQERESEKKWNPAEYN